MLLPVTRDWSRKGGAQQERGPPRAAQGGLHVVAARCAPAVQACMLPGGPVQDPPHSITPRQCAGLLRRGALAGPALPASWLVSSRTGGPAVRAPMV
jgi:hypothetical protein